MKAIKCEMCGSNDVVKQGEFFVCQNCGTKYEPEAARKLLVEIDNSVKLEKNYEAARAARKAGNDSLAGQLYSQILQDDPNSWEALLYSTICPASETTIVNIAPSVSRVESCLKSVFDLIGNRCSTPDERMHACKTAFNSVSVLVKALYSSAYDHYMGIDTSIRSRFNQEMANRGFACKSAMLELGDNLMKTANGDKEIQDLAVRAWKDGVDISKGYLNLMADRSSNFQSIQQIASIIRQYDPSYDIWGTSVKQADDGSDRETRKMLTPWILLLILGVLYLLVKIAS